MSRLLDCDTNEAYTSAQLVALCGKILNEEYGGDGVVFAVQHDTAMGPYPFFIHSADDTAIEGDLTGTTDAQALDLATCMINDVLEGALEDIGAEHCIDDDFTIIGWAGVADDHVVTRTIVQLEV